MRNLTVTNTCRCGEVSSEDAGADRVLNAQIQQVTAIKLIVGIQLFIVKDSTAGLEQQTCSDVHLSHRKCIDPNIIMNIRKKH